MNADEALKLVNEKLGFVAAVTEAGDELKVYIPVVNGPGITRTFLTGAELWELGEALKVLSCGLRVEKAR